LGAISAFISAGVCALAEKKARDRIALHRILFIVIVFNVYTIKVRKVTFGIGFTPRFNKKKLW